MAAPDGRTPEAKTLYIGKGVTINGAVVVCDTVVVDGELAGDIEVDNLQVGATGTVTGRIRVARNAEIAGKVSDRIALKINVLNQRRNKDVDGRNKSSHNELFAQSQLARFRP
jgi:cytoskeletal protein CcmA (bactofilin family)